jgi:hypothetical protein
MYDYHIAVALGHWLRLKGDGGHSGAMHGSVGHQKGGDSLREPYAQPPITRSFILSHIQQRHAHAQYMLRF